MVYFDQIKPGILFRIPNERPSYIYFKTLEFSCGAGVFNCLKMHNSNSSYNQPDFVPNDMAVSTDEITQTIR